MSCVFQNLAGLQNRYPLNQWQEILGNCDVTLFLGCTDALTADFISQRTGEASISVTSKAKQLGTWRISNYTPEYRETSGVGKRRLMTMDEVLRMDVDRALVIIRGKNVLEVDKYDYSKHPEAKKLRPSKASSHVPDWRAAQEKKRQSKPPAKKAVPPEEPAQGTAQQGKKGAVSPAPTASGAKKKPAASKASAKRQRPSPQAKGPASPSKEKEQSAASAQPAVDTERPAQAPVEPTGTTRVVTATRDSIFVKQKPKCEKEE